MKITHEDVLMGRIKRQDLTAEQAQNLDILVQRINALFETFDETLVVSSGYRSPSQNALAGGAKKSHHMNCAAIDLRDLDGKIWKFCIDNIELCEKLGIWLEDKGATPTWTHLQVYPPKSRRRIFRP